MMMGGVMGWYLKINADIFCLIQFIQRTVRKKIVASEAREKNFGIYLKEGKVEIQIRNGNVE